MRSRSRGDRPERRPLRQRRSDAVDRRGTNTTAVALVLLGVLVVAAGIGAGLVSAIQSELKPDAGQASAVAPPDADQRAEALPRLMERLQADQERVQEKVQGGPPPGETTAPPAEDRHPGAITR